MDHAAAAQLLWSSASSSSSGAEMALSAAAAAAAVGFVLCRRARRRHQYNVARRRGGSTLGRAPNASLSRLHAAQELDRDYFCRNGDGEPAASSARFTKDWRMSRDVYERIRSELIKDSYFDETRRDAAGCPPCSADQKMCAALLQLVDGVSSRAVWKYLKIGSSTATESLKQFSRSVVHHFKGEYLRDPSADELQGIAAEYEVLGFPGCVGCLDCAGWEWDACPVGWHGNYKGAAKKPSLRMEAVCDDYLYCWHLNFGVPGSKNDLSILYASSLFQRIRQGSWPPSQPKSTIAGMALTWFYYLTDGIYPDWRVFVKTYKTPRNKKEKTFGKQQESVRKAIERFFGVLFRRYRILRQPCALWFKEDMACIMQACVIMHNMTVRERKATYTGTRAARVEADAAETEDAGTTTYHKLDPPTDPIALVEWMHETAGQVENRKHHDDLKAALAEHMYARAGDCAGESSSGDDFETDSDGS